MYNEAKETLCKSPKMSFSVDFKLVFMLKKSQIEDNYVLAGGGDFSSHEVCRYVHWFVGTCTQPVFQVTN